MEEDIVVEIGGNQSTYLKKSQVNQLILDFQEVHEKLSNRKFQELRKSIATNKLQHDSALKSLETKMQLQLDQLKAQVEAQSKTIQKYKKKLKEQKIKLNEIERASEKLTSLGGSFVEELAKTKSLEDKFSFMDHILHTIKGEVQELKTNATMQSYKAESELTFIKDRFVDHKITESSKAPVKEKSGVGNTIANLGSAIGGPAGAVLGNVVGNVVEKVLPGV